MRFHDHRQFLIHRQRGLFIRIGFAITLLLVIWAFSWKSKEASPKKSATTDFVFPIEDTQINIIFAKDKRSHTKQMDITRDVTIEVIDNSGDKVAPVLPIGDPDFSDVGKTGMPSEELGLLDVPDRVFKWVEVNPTFPGGDQAFRQYINEHIVFPDEMKRIGASGQVTIVFVIDENGNVTQVQVARGTYAAFNREAQRVIKNSPKWIPGRMGDRAVKVMVSIPINFTYRP